MAETFVGGGRGFASLMGCGSVVVAVVVLLRCRRNGVRRVRGRGRAVRMLRGRSRGRSRGRRAVGAMVELWLGQ